MSPLLRALGAEWIKLRGTLALALCAITPLVVVALYVLQFSVASRMPEKAPDGATAWLTFAQSALTLWALLMLPLFITLQAALLAGLEHGNQQWKHLLALPVPPRVHYLAKWLVLAAMVGASTLLLVLMVPVGGMLVAKLQPGYGIAGPPPWVFLLEKAALVFICSQLAVALQTWLAIRWRSFTVAVAAGMVATVMGYLIVQSKDYGPFYPWAMPIQPLASSAEHLPLTLAFSLIGAVVVTGLGLWNFVRRGDG